MAVSNIGCSAIMVELGQIVFYKASREEMNWQLNLFGNRRIETPLEDNFSVALVLYTWPDNKVDLSIFHNDGQTSFKRAIKHISATDPGYSCWLTSEELSHYGENNDNRS